MKLREYGEKYFKKRKCPGERKPTHSAAYRIFGIAYLYEKCSGTLELRLNKRKNTLFWGCSRFPDCTASSVFIPDIDKKP